MTKLCTIEGCEHQRATAGTQANNRPIYRNFCRLHYNKIAERQREELAIENGFKNYNEYRANANEELAIENGFKNYNEYVTFKKEELAISEGYEDATARRNAKHRYRWALKTYCENVDSRLGFRCTTTIMLSSQLEIDHIDGNPSNDEGKNLQTLCGCCHTYKTLTEKDYLTPGRKALGLKN